MGRKEHHRHVDSHFSFIILPGTMSEQGRPTSSFHTDEPEAAHLALCGRKFLPP